MAATLLPPQATKAALLSGQDEDQSELRAQYERAMAQHNARMQQAKEVQDRSAALLVA